MRIEDKNKGRTTTSICGCMLRSSQRICIGLALVVTLIAFALRSNLLSQSAASIVSNYGVVDDTTTTTTTESAPSKPFVRPMTTSTTTKTSQQQHSQHQRIYTEPPPSSLRFILNKTRSGTTSSSANNNNNDNPKMTTSQTQIATASSEDSPDMNRPNKKKKAKPKVIPLCRRYLIKAGQWLRDTSPTSKPAYVPTVQHLKCYPNTVYSQIPYPHNYKWIPDAAFVGECQFDDYNPQELCNILQGGTISIIGDSLSWEHYRSLVSLHHIKTHQGYQQQSWELNTNIHQQLCTGNSTTRVVYRRDDYLHNIPASLKQDFPTVLILNRGAHYVSDTELLTDIRKVITQVKAWLRVCEAKYNIQCHFFWRSTVPGHLNCDTQNFTTPLNDLEWMEQQTENISRYDNISIEYHWHDFRRQNELVEAEFRKADLTNFQMIDAYHINILRPDEHRAHQNDCLHSCFPGKMDVYNQLLLHFLKMQRSSRDVQRLINVATKEQWMTTLQSDTIYLPNETAVAHKARLEREAAAMAAAEQQPQAAASKPTTATTTRRNVNDDDEDEDDEDEDDSSDGDDEKPSDDQEEEEE